mgnify:CR=1 FL=1
MSMARLRGVSPNAVAALGSVLTIALCAGFAACDDGADSLLRKAVETTDDPVAPAPDSVPRSGVRRLTRQEYDATVEYLLADDTHPSQMRLPGDARSPFDNDSATQEVSPALIEGAEFLATEVSARFLKSPVRDKVIGCVPSGAGDVECLRHFVTTFGRRALRQPLAADEVARFVDAGQATANAEGDFYAGADVVLRAFLQDLRFLYRIEIGTPISDRPGLFRLSDWEVASRLSFFLWGSTPDDALLDRAAASKLHTGEDVKAAALDMLGSPRAKATVERFHSLWLGYEGLPFDPKLADAMQVETSALIRRVVFDEKRPWQDIFRLDETFVPDFLADHYGLPKHGSDQPAWTKYGTSGRLGLLSQGSFLSNGAKFADTSPTMRGKAVRERLLCQPIPPPPPSSVTDEPPPATGSATCKIDRYKEISRSAGCANCHGKMDPIGFGLENYDEQGRFRKAESADCAIDGNGEVQGVGKFNGPGELAKVILQSDELTSCAVTQLYRFAQGRSELAEADQAIVGGLTQAVAKKDFRFDELLVSVVSVPSFLYRHEQE